MKYCFITLTLFLGLFSTTTAFGQNGTHKKLRSRAVFNYYPVSGMIDSADSTRYYYDDYGRYSDIYRWSSYSVANGWGFAGRTTEYAYDPNGNLLGSVAQYYVDTLGWLNSSRDIYTYDSNDSLLMFIEQKFNNSTGWVNDLRISFSYDAAGNRLSSVVENWKDSIWVLNNALYFTYDAAGHVLTRTTDDFYRITYAYDGAGNILSETSMHLENGIWQVSSRRIYLYGIIPGLPATEIWNQIWNNQTWKTYSRFSYTYNASGDLTDLLYQYKAASGWNNSGLYHYEFNQNHQEVFYEYKEWKNGAWAKHTRHFTTYDADSDAILGKREQWNGAWYEISVGRYHYDETLPVYTLQHNDFLLFPNPATDVVTLKGREMLSAEIFNVKGEMLSSSSLFGVDEKTFQLGSIPAGNYFMRVQMKDGKVGLRPFQVR